MSDWDTLNNDTDGQDAAPLTVRSLNGPPTASAPSVNPSASPYYSEFDYSIHVLDLDGDTVQVTLEVRDPSSASWESQGTRTVYGNGTVTWLNRTPFEANDIGYTAQYRFQYSDGHHSGTWGPYSGPSIINTPPTGSNPRVTPPSGTLSQLFDYAIDVNDADGDRMTVTLEILDPSSQMWEDWGQAIIDGSGTALWTTIEPFEVDDIGLTASFRFRYNDVNTTGVWGPYFGPSVVNRPPTSSNPQVSPTGAPYYSPFTFSIEVSDGDDEAVIVRLEVEDPSTNSWVDFGTRSVAGSGIAQWLNVFPFDGDDAGSIARYRFQSSDPHDLATWGPFDAPLVMAACDGDVDFDVDVDSADWERMLDCWAGPDTPNPGCPSFGAADLDVDGDVDLTDFVFFQRRVGDSCVDVGNTCSTAHALDLDVAEFSTIDPPTDLDWFAFSAEPNHQYHVELQALAQSGYGLMCPQSCQHQF